MVRRGALRRVGGLAGCHQLLRLLAMYRLSDKSQSRKVKSRVESLAAKSCVSFLSEGSFTLLHSRESFHSRYSLPQTMNATSRDEDDMIE